jgi:hypothetical protein
MYGAQSSEPCRHLSATMTARLPLSGGEGAARSVNGNAVDLFAVVQGSEYWVEIGHLEASAEQRP